MANISTAVVEDRIREYGKMWMIDDLIRLRGQDEVQAPILGYPRYEDDAAEYELFTGKDLDRMVDETCRLLVAAGFEVNSNKTLALFAHSDLSFVVTLFAIFRLGCKALMMSIRLSKPACLFLLERTGCDAMLHGSTVNINSTVADLKEARQNLQFLPMPARKDFDKPGVPTEPFVRPIPDKEAEHVQPVLMGHSSGSTGLPKPLALSHRSLLNNVFSGTGCKAFNALPWYHAHGLFTSMAAMYMRKTAYLFNAHLPLTAGHLVSALKVAQPEICHTVPYALKLMAESPEGVEVLKGCKFVTAAGARTPDELGDSLVQQGIKFGVIFGSTEVGHMGDSIYREPGDDSWVYIRPYGSLLKHVVFKKLNEGVYECVYLKSHPALLPVTSNSDDPPGSYHSRDLFTPHPTIENAWKYIARDDDRITLLNGEKILPNSMEGTVRQSPLVRDALMVGNDRLMPGLLVFRSPAAAGLSEDEFISAISPEVKAANEIMDEFARITPDMIASIPADTEYPVTDKNNIIRAAATAKFADIITSLYDKDGKSGKNLQLDIEQLEQFIVKVFRELAGVELPDLESDFFAAGIDSLRAAQVRRLLQLDLDLGGQSLPTNAVYDAGTAAKLAGVLYSMRTGQKLENGHSNDESEISKMEKLIAEYGQFDMRKPGEQPTPEKDVVILTGATGALGAHLLNQLLDDPKVDKVYCLVRGADALGRVSESMKARGLSLDGENGSRVNKLTALTTDNFGAPNLGLSSDVYATLQNSTTLIIHAAWPVNFNISLASFTPQIAGLRNLLDLARNVPFRDPARLLFASSISTAFRTPMPGSVPEAPLASLEHAAATGYGRSKLVSERICDAAGRSGEGGSLVGLLRVGQISADSVHGIWNDKEHIPLLVRSATELGALPRLHGYEGRCEWMPVNTVARTFLQLADTLLRTAVETGGDNNKKAAFYNVVPPHAFSWNDEFLPALREVGLQFEEVDVAVWLAKLRKRAAELGAEAEERLPAFKLADYYEETYGDTGEKEKGGSELRYENGRACAESEALSACPLLSEVGIVRKMVGHWLRDEEGFAGK
ncbi:Uu.00g081110.m01.CDS01 [Anthostomella pinea]|uniref:Uu.00g081110.m01.CDS01 n=1 Tax=Anthostomella pinea TaxID=933095 RepID=A0AAI8VM94_9PEZI|nr:Uu.00g081110.m01.CDS01 [Anthostomella pinea]